MMTFTVISYHTSSISCYLDTIIYPILLGLLIYTFSLKSRINKVLFLTNAQVEKILVKNNVSIMAVLLFKSTIAFNMSAKLHECMSCPRMLRYKLLYKYLYNFLRIRKYWFVNIYYIFILYTFISIFDLSSKIRIISYKDKLQNNYLKQNSALHEK